MDGRELLVALVREQAAATECWQRAETCVRAGELRAQLEELGVTVTRDVAVSMMAVAMYRAACSPEWGGDERDALADLAALGLELHDA